jgi:wyosine [tRNA(Phe)-imidazoG37] synthetase (radical SAM superfamily)
MLWKNIFYGPVSSRRLGFYLGINLLPDRKKICSFDCIYCECGLNDNSPKEALQTFEDYKEAIHSCLNENRSINQRIDHITFSGNGEPTLHPEFDKIIDHTVLMRDKFYPETKIAVLTNSTNLHIPKIFNSLQKVDVPFCKLDAGSEETYQLIDSPVSKKTLDEITDSLIKFDGNIIIQTIFLKGDIDNKVIDNTSEKELNLYIKRLKKINPKKVVIYRVDRTPPYSSVIKLSEQELKSISEFISKFGFNVEYYV